MATQRLYLSQSGSLWPDGSEQVYYLKETNVLIKEDEKWKIIHIHTSKSI
ncbi:MAG: nuclear transport factor 2 family protein [Saprospiraceae bacterium]|nr:nuclear transport factor 2 family protein [Saprospiraceae bacterium]